MTDYKVLVVTAFQELNVRKVTFTPTIAGKWQFEYAFADFTICYVTAFLYPKCCFSCRFTLFLLLQFEYSDNSETKWMSVNKNFSGLFCNFIPSFLMLPLRTFLCFHSELFYVFTPNFSMFSLRTFLYFHSELFIL